VDDVVGQLAWFADRAADEELVDIVAGVDEEPVIRFGAIRASASARTLPVGVENRWSQEIAIT
jgi:hypothetical protein